MKNIKKLVLITIFTAGITQHVIHADPATQDRIRIVIKKHESKLQGIRTNDDLRKFLKVLITDLKEAVKNAPNTPEYKQLRDALNKINPDQITTLVGNLRIVLNNLDGDIRKTIIDAIPTTFRALLMIA